MTLMIEEKSWRYCKYCDKKFETMEEFNKHFEREEEE